MPIFKDSNKKLKGLMNKLEVLYTDCGGFIIKSEEFCQDGSATSLDAFESLCFTVNRKMIIVRKNLKMYHKKRKFSVNESELDEDMNKIRYFIDSLKNDSKKLGNIFNTDKAKRYISFVKGEYILGMDPKIIKQREDLLQEINVKITKFKRECESDEEDKKLQREKLLQIMTETDPDVVEEEEKEEDFTSDPNFVINVRAIKKKIEDLENLRDEKMSQINKNLEEQLEKARETGDLLDEGNQKIKDLITKSETIIDLQNSVSKNLDKANKEASGQVKFVVGIISAIVCIMFLALGIVIIGVVISSF